MASLLRRSELGTEQAPGRQPPPYVLSSHQVIPRFKLQSSEPFRDTGDVIMTLLGGRKCQNNVSPRFGNEYGWMVIVTGWYLQHNSSNTSEGMIWRDIMLVCWYWPRILRPGRRRGRVDSLPLHRRSSRRWPCPRTWRPCQAGCRDSGWEAAPGTTLPGSTPLKREKI